jgi:hypothetical protein
MDWMFIARFNDLYVFDNEPFAQHSSGLKIGMRGKQHGEVASSTMRPQGVTQQPGSVNCGLAASSARKGNRNTRTNQGKEAGSNPDLTSIATEPIDRMDDGILRRSSRPCYAMELCAYKCWSINTIIRAQAAAPSSNSRL